MSASEKSAESAAAATNDRCWINGGGFALDGKTHMTGAQIRALPMPSIRDSDDLYMEVPGGEDLIVQYDEVVPVAGRRFFSVPAIINAGAPSAASRPRLLDLFCGAGGAAMGYHRAGFEVVGVDIAPQPRYPFEFHQEDVLDIDVGYRAFLGKFAAIHASPPCQAYTRAGALRTVKIDHPDLIGPTRELLEATGFPYVLENVPGAPLIEPVQLCGTAFSIGGDTHGWELQRHRLFEANFPLVGTGCYHRLPAISVVGHGATKATRERLGRNPVIAEKRAAMGIDWMNRDELSEAIPPAYTEFIGRQLLAYIRQEQLTLDV